VYDKEPVWNKALLNKLKDKVDSNEQIVLNGWVRNGFFTTDVSTPGGRKFALFLVLETAAAYGISVFISFLFAGTTSFGIAEIFKALLGSTILGGLATILIQKLTSLISSGSFSINIILPQTVSYGNQTITYYLVYTYNSEGELVGINYLRFLP